MNATINPASGQPIAPDVLRTFAARVYRSAGVPEVEAQLAADTLVQADLWGHQSHGMLRLGWYYARLCSGAMKAVTHTTLEVDAGAIARQFDDPEKIRAAVFEARVEAVKGLHY